MESTQAEHRSLIYGLSLALVCGMVAAIAVAALVAQDPGRSGTRELEHQIALTSIANTAAASLLSKTPYRENRVFEDQLLRFSAFNFLLPGSAFCIIDRSGRVVFHSSDESVVGQHLGDMLLADTAGDVDALLASAGQWSGISDFSGNGDQIAAFQYWESFQGIVAVHTPLGMLRRTNTGSTAGASSLVVPPVVLILLAGFVVFAVWSRGEHRRVVLEERLDTVSQDLAQSQRSQLLVSLAAGAAHDLKNMMTVIHGGAELLATTSLAAREQRLSAGIKRASASGYELCQRLLTLRNVHSSTPCWLNLQETCSQFIEDWSSLFGRKMTFDLIAVAPDAFVYIDPLDLQQVLLNLVLNCNALERSHVSVTLEIAPVTETPPDVYPGSLTQPCWRLTVRDNGPGLPESEVRKFLHEDEPSAQVTDDDSRSGLGLRLVGETVARAGGCVRVEAGLGTRFELYFPRHEEQSATGD